MKEDGNYETRNCEEYSKVFSTYSQWMALNALHGPEIYCYKLRPKRVFRTVINFRFFLFAAEQKEGDVSGNLWNIVQSAEDRKKIDKQALSKRK